MKSNTIPPGWKGGFMSSNPKFEYPKPNLTSLPIMGNMANVNLLTRQQAVRWPEFSWKTGIPNPDPDSPNGGNDSDRCFQMFSPFISRLGYNDIGRVYSIICPQQGVWLGNELCLNVEVTVTGVRGWVNESSNRDERIMAADMTVQPRIWLTPKGYQGEPMRYLWDHIQMQFPHFPLSKDNAILLNTYEPGNPHHPYFYVRKGQSDQFNAPEFSKHEEASYTVANLEVEIGEPIKTHDPKADEFNALLMAAFNLGSGNMLANKNVLTWNVWFLEPSLVNQNEWRAHAEQWRKSIDAHHGPPYHKSRDKYGPLASSPIRYYDGRVFESEGQKITHILEEIYEWLHKHLHI